MASIPFHLITGFLGSGKTSFLIHYLGSFGKERRIGVIQNEFSSSGIDGEIVRKTKGAYQLLEVNNGSVFCVCLLGGFIESLAAFIDDNSPDEIIMEASGMSDPVSIAQIFQSPQLKNKIYLDKSWAIVDALNFNKVTSIRIRLEHQIRIAETVIINKTDLAESEIATIIETVKKINPFATILKSSYAKIPFLNEKESFKFFHFPENSGSNRPDLQSLVIKSSLIITPENLKKFIETVKNDFIRFKGFVNTGKKQKYIVQGSFDYYTFEEVEWFAGVTELVGIGKFQGIDDYTKKFETYCKK